ncbi:type III-B CRISPR module-associated protein Cmr3 [Aceticella autotrophica]|uniref:Type III-B CRISPR module-associated protein Cmr3 n=1 Tax=Aceticella autotrophica TaxID=2755338 RepID=A0A975AW72_9THEO|nr:type III-B CRISPR module-associated protein Cmr3 [Aceticella autotrophica]QSZ27585.1 type III-B CRISPR module-associated protein Cmr3 [Aceticella autotrophica]
MFIKIKPIDTLFFRTARPFSKGEDTWADLVFPPYPSTLYGAIRSYLIFKNGTLKDFYNGKFKDILGTPEEKAKFSIKGPLLISEEKPIFKVPNDLIKVKGNDKKLYPLQFCKKPFLMVSNYNFDNAIVWKEKEVIDDAEGWLSSLYFKNYLTGKSKEFYYGKNDDYFQREEKIGITRDKVSKTSKDECLYRMSMIRLKKNVGFVAEIENINNLGKNGVLQLGGESKAVAFEECDDIFKDLKDIEFKFNENLFKIYLATPAIFKKGWLPGWIEESSLKGNYNGIEVKLLACAIGKPIPIGGWKLNAGGGKPKPLKKAVPSGSIYYFKVLNDADANKIKDVFHFKNISDINPEEGFGLSIVGVVMI